MRISFFYENKNTLSYIDDDMRKKVSAYSMSQIDQLKYIESDFLVLELANNEIENIINKLERFSSTPYIIISENITKNYHALYLVEVVDKKDILTVKEKILGYFRKNVPDDFSIFELPDVMQMISMEKKDIAIRIFSENGYVGAIAFDKGCPVYAKSIMDKESEIGLEAAYKILSWENIKFKLIKVIGDIPNNLNIDLTNLLLGAMQYKDELVYVEQNIEDVIKSGNKIDCKTIVDQFSNLKGYLGIAAYRNNEELCNNHLNNSYIKNKDLKDSLYKVNKLVESMLYDIGISGFSGLILSSAISTAIIEHDGENNIDIILFLEKDSNIPLSKLMIRKVIAGLL